MYSMHGMCQKLSKGCTLGQAKGSHTAIIGGERTLPDSTSGRVAGNQPTVRVKNDDTGYA